MSKAKRTLRPRKLKPVELRFFEKVNKTDTCWLWTGAKYRDGYGAIGAGRRNEGTIATHILSWKIHFGDIPNGLWVLHKCDVRLCVNPEHLFLGTRQDNIDDMVSKSRNAKRERSGRVKLTEEDISQLRSLASFEILSYRELGEIFGIVGSAAWGIVNNKLWVQNT